MGWRGRAGVLGGSWVCEVRERSKLWDARAMAEFGNTVNRVNQHDVCIVRCRVRLRLALEW